MYLTDLKAGEGAVLLALPHAQLPGGFRPGERVSLIMSRPELSVVSMGSNHYALAGFLAAQIVVVRAPT